MTISAEDKAAVETILDGISPTAGGNPIVGYPGKFVAARQARPEVAEELESLNAARIEIMKLLGFQGFVELFRLAINNEWPE